MKPSLTETKGITVNSDDQTTVLKKAIQKSVGNQEITLNPQILKVNIKRKKEELEKKKKELIRKEDELLDSINDIKKRIKKIIKRKLNLNELNDQKLAEILGNYQEYFEEQFKIQKKYLKNIKRRRYDDAFQDHFLGVIKKTSRLAEIDIYGNVKKVSLAELRKKYKVNRPELLLEITNEINEERKIFSELKELEAEMKIIKKQIQESENKLN